MVKPQIFSAHPQFSPHHDCPAGRAMDSEVGFIISSGREGSGARALSLAS